MSAEWDSEMKRMAITGGLLTIVMASALYLSDSRAEDVIHNSFRVNNVALVEVVFHNGFPVSKKASVSECEACHDGSIAKAVPLCMAESCFLTPGSHPVNTPYPPIKERNMYMTAAVVKAAGVILVNGQVTCVSCHNLANPEQFHLVIEIDRSKLCLTCHIK